MFIGEYQHALDEKGRIAIPVKFRRELEQGAVVTRGLDHCLSELIDEREKNKAKSTIRLRVLEGMSGPWARFILWILMGVTHGSAALADMLADDLDFLSGSPFRASVFGLFVVYLLFYLVPAITLQFYCYPKHWLLGAEHLFFLTMALLPGIAVIALAGETYRLHASFLAFNHYAAFHALATFLFMTSLVPSVLHCALSRAPEEEVKRDVEQRPLILEDSDIRIMVEVPQLAMQFPKTVDERDLKTLSSTVLENLARITPRFNSKDAAPAVIFDTPFSGDNTQAFLAMMSDYRIKLLGLAPIIHGMNACVQFVLGQTDSWESVCDACNFEANKLVLPKSAVSEVAAVQAALAVKEKTLDKRLLAFHVLDAYRKILNNIVAVVPHSQS